VSNWRNYPDARRWERLGYVVALERPATSFALYSLVASPPLYLDHRLRLVFNYGEQVAAVLEQKPIGRQRLWREVAVTHDWTQVPAPWFARTVQVLLQQRRLA